MIVSNKAIQRIAQIMYGQEKKMRTEASTSRPSQPADEVTLTAEGRVMQALQRRLAEVPEVRHERVEALRRAIARGEYRVSAEKIAERILAQEDGTM